MQAIRAIFDGVNFTPQQPIPVQKKCEVIITFLEPNEPTDAKTQTAADPYPEHECASVLPYKRGCMKNKMWMAEDFDAPLDDFKEYME